LCGMFACLGETWGDRTASQRGYEEQAKDQYR
jgi:hypothetical protein